MRCYDCGYELTATETASGQCPQCGSYALEDDDEDEELDDAG